MVHDNGGTPCIAPRSENSGLIVSRLSFGAMTCGRTSWAHEGNRAGKLI